MNLKMKTIAAKKSRMSMWEGVLTMDELYDYDYCYECQGYGDDYYMDEHGEWVSACDDCPHNNAWRNDNG